MTFEQLHNATQNPWFTLEVVLDPKVPQKMKVDLHHPDGKVDHYLFTNSETIELSFRDMVEFRVGESS